MHQVRYFLAVARLLNFTRAAEACNVTQPSLTRAVQKLEHELGGALFYRERASTQLTALGRQMEPHLVQIHAAAEAARSAARSFSKACGGTLNLGIATSVASPALHRALADIAAALPEIGITLSVASSQTLSQNMLAGLLDLSILAQDAEESERLDFWRLFGRRLCLVTGLSHRLANRAEVGIGDLSGEVLIHCNDDGTALLERMVARTGQVADFRHRVPSADHAGGLISAGMGSAVLPAHDPLSPELAQVPFDDSLPALDIGLAAVAGRARSPVIERFLRAARARRWQGL